MSTSPDFNGIPTPDSGNSIDPFVTELNGYGLVKHPELSARQTLIQYRLDNSLPSTHKPQLLSSIYGMIQDLTAANFPADTWIPTLSGITDLPEQTLNDFWQGLRAEFIYTPCQVVSTAFIKELGNISSLGINQMAVHHSVEQNIRDAIAMAQTNGNPHDFYKRLYLTESTAAPLSPNHFTPVMGIEISAFMMHEQESATGNIGSFEERVLRIARLHPSQQKQGITRLSRELGIN